MANYTDDGFFLWELSRKLNKTEVLSLLKHCWIMFSDQQIMHWTAYELFQNLLKANKIKFDEKRQPRNWIILTNIFEIINRKDLIREVDNFGKNFQSAQVIFGKNANDLALGRLLSNGNSKILRGKFNDQYDVAVKQFYPSSYSTLDEQVQKKFFLNQMDLIGSLNHKKVLGRDDVFLFRKYDQSPYYVMEYFPKMDLSSMLKRNGTISLDNKILIEYAKQIAEGMKYLHGKNILHCNLKADNILVGEENIKISGFSSAREIKHQDDVSDIDEDVMLAIKWMALEVILHRRYCKPSDVWSYAVVLTELFEKGKSPYNEHSNKDTIEFLCEGNRLAKPTHCSEAMYRGLILRCWNVDPKNRPTFDEISKILENYLDIQVVPSQLQSIQYMQNRRSLYIHPFQLPNVDQTHIVPLQAAPYMDTISPDLLDISSEILGKGEYGIVKKGKLNYLGQNYEVAAKTFNSQSATVEEFEQEITIAKELSHPNIVKMVGVCRINNEELYLVTELLNSGSLQKLLRENPSIVLTEKTNVVLQICSAMVYLESKHVVHRDLAARNVLVSYDYKTYKISDFGLASVTNEENNIYQAVNQISVRWCAPEVLLRNVHGTKSDVWSFGILLVELFSYGEHPYKEWGNHEVIKQVLSGFKHLKPPLCHDKLYHLMLTFWYMDPNKRPSFSSISENLNTILSDI